MLDWSDTFATKIKIIDEQHKTIFELLNKLSDCIADSTYSEGQVSDALKALNDYSVNHFQMEAKLMQQMKVDPRHVRLHCMEHQSFIYDTQHLWVDPITEENSIDVSSKLANFIIAWWTYHILGTDQSLAQQVFAIRQGASPEHAYETWQSSKLDAQITRMMLDAVLDLWRTSTKRCHQLEEKIIALRAGQ